MAAAHLSSGRVNINLIREAARRELLEFLDKCVGTKAIVWDEVLTRPFVLISDYALLKDHDVTRMFQMKMGRLPPSNVQNIIFLVRPKLPLMDIIADNVHKEEELGGQRKDFHIFFVPRKSLLCEKRLKELGVYGTFNSVDEYSLDLFPVDSDVLSMENESSFKEYHLEGDMTTMFHAAKSLMTLQALYGVIPNIYGKGKQAKQVYDLMMRMRRELAGCEPQLTPQIDNLVLIDRSIDLLTPLATQLTYEGLIDEIYGIKNTSVKLPPEKFTKSNDGGPQDLTAEPKEFLLNSSEELYSEIRDKNFSAVGPALSRKAKLISAQFDERHGAKTVGEIKQFVAKLPHMQAAKQSLATHTSIAELVKEVTDTESFLESLQVEQEFMNGIDTDKVNVFIEDCIAKQAPLMKVLRLVCMQSVTNNGLKQKVLEYYKRDIIQTYGYQHMLTFSYLEKTGLLKLQTSKNYSTIRKTLRLVVEDVHEQNPSDIAYVYSGYAPLSVRLVQFLNRPGWRAITDVLSLIPGPTIEEIQQIPVGLRKRRGSGSSTHSSLDDQKITLVFFLGGCTFAEIACLRFLGQQDDASSEYVIATTKLINGTTFLKSIIEKPNPVESI
ncbi:Vacuolar protein sorting-associated protein 33A [Nymphon striatum]|nr:Vacuolar protein sorting-associated protein 33A [Nymphon striatum]